MYLKCLTCEVLARPVYLCAAYSPNIVDVELYPRGLHNDPSDLRTRLQEQIDNTEGYEAVVLAYGLCGQGTAGLMARNIPLVIPRAHDCITLFLGSRQRYLDQFTNHPGTYWYTQDYVERDDGSGGVLSVGSGSDLEIQTVYNDYVLKYGKDNADYLMEVMGAWQSHYRRAVYIDMGIGEGKLAESEAQTEATRRGWTFEGITGDRNLIRRLVDGDWENDFLVVQPGHQIKTTYDDEIIA